MSVETTPAPMMPIAGLRPQAETSGVALRPIGSTPGIDAGAPTPDDKPRVQVTIDVSGRGSGLHSIRLRAELDDTLDVERAAFDLNGGRRALDLTFHPNIDLEKEGEVLTQLLQDQLRKTHFGKRVSNEEQELRRFEEGDTSNECWLREKEMSEFLCDIAVHGRKLFLNLFGLKSMVKREEQRGVFLEAIRSVFKRARLVSVNSDYSRMPRRQAVTSEC